MNEHMLVLQLPLMTIKQLINIAVLRHFRHMQHKKKCSASGGHSSQTPVIGSRSALAICPPNSNPGSTPGVGLDLISQRGCTYIRTVMMCKFSGKLRAERSGRLNTFRFCNPSWHLGWTK